MNLRIVGSSLVTLAGLACSSPTAPERNIMLTVVSESITVSNRSLRLDVRVRNETSKGIKPLLCGTVRLALVEPSGGLVDVTSPLECAAISLETKPFIPPYSEAVVSVNVLSTVELSISATYRVGFPVFIEGSAEIPVVTSSDFKLFPIYATGN
jgi:hypothetical protein